MKRHAEIYTDGACEPNPGPGGWGYVILEEEETNVTGSGGNLDTTNNQMELTAVIEALNQFEEPISATILSDSQYVVNGINIWLNGWVKNNFKKGKVKNRDLWEQLLDYKRTHDLVAVWVHSHVGIKYNERADSLATYGMKCL